MQQASKKFINSICLHKDFILVSWWAVWEVQFRGFASHDAIVRSRSANRLPSPICALETIPFFIKAYSTACLLSCNKAVCLDAMLIIPLQCTHVHPLIARTPYLPSCDWWTRTQIRRKFLHPKESIPSLGRNTVQCVMTDVCLASLRVLPSACLVRRLLFPLTQLIISMLFQAFSILAVGSDQAHSLTRTTSRYYCETHTAIPVSLFYLFYHNPVTETLSSSPKMPQIDAEHRGPLINIAAWVTLAAMLLIISGKVATKWKMIRTFQSDDVLMVLAMVSLESLGFKNSYAQIHSIMSISPQLLVTALPQQYRCNLVWASLERHWTATSSISTKRLVIAR